jgi:sugar phosphate isomerase/epimerase
MVMNTPSRREFLEKTSLGAAALVALPQAKPGGRKRLPIGVQLYSVRAIAAKDLAGSLAAIKKIGFDGVEFSGFYGHDAKTLRSLLDANGLRCCGAHVEQTTLMGDELARTIEFVQTLNTSFIVCPFWLKENQGTVEGFERTAVIFSEIAEKLKPHKMHLGYHNRGKDFAPMNGTTLWDIFYTKASRDVFMQLDVPGCLRQGGDPGAVIRKYPGRTLTVHLHDFAPGAKGTLIGDGAVKWDDVLSACESAGGTQWYIVEEESGAHPEFTGIAQNFQRLKKLLS